MKVSVAVSYEERTDWTDTAKRQLVALIGRSAKVQAEREARRQLGLPSVQDDANAELARRTRAA